MIRDKWLSTTEAKQIGTFSLFFCDDKDLFWDREDMGTLSSIRTILIDAYLPVRIEAGMKQFLKDLVDENKLALPFRSFLGEKHYRIFYDLRIRQL